jgi:hypothetical protein
VAGQTADFWRKLEILLSPVGGLLTAVSVAVIGICGTYLLNKKQELDARNKVFTELTSQREQAETVLRKDMFAQIIGSVLKPEESSQDLRVLYMELLAYNFHESLNLKPLFSYVQRQLDRTAAPKELRDRLEKVAKEIARKQLLVLEEGGRRFSRTLDLVALSHDPDGIVLDSGSLTLDKIERTFELTAFKADIKNRELQLRLKVTTHEPFPETNDVTFWLGFYDFPMIDNTRLSKDQRCAVVLNKFCEDENCTAEVTFVLFPGSRASLQEKAFSEDLIRQLQKPFDSKTTK